MHMRIIPTWHQKQIKTSTKPPSLLTSPLSWLLGGPVSGRRNVLWGWSCSRSLGPARGKRHPTKPLPLRSARAGRPAAGMPRPGGEEFYWGDLPGKCHAGSDEERNLDREGERERRKGALSQLKHNLSVSFQFCRMLTDDGPVAE